MCVCERSLIMLLSSPDSFLSVAAITHLMSLPASFSLLSRPSRSVNTHSGSQVVCRAPLIHTLLQSTNTSHIKNLHQYPSVLSDSKWVEKCCYFSVLWFHFNINIRAFLSKAVLRNCRSSLVSTTDWSCISCLLSNRPTIIQPNTVDSFYNQRYLKDWFQKQQPHLYILVRKNCCLHFHKELEDFWTSLNDWGREELSYYSQWRRQEKEEIRLFSATTA